MRTGFVVILTFVFGLVVGIYLDANVMSLGEHPQKACSDIYQRTC